MLKKVETVTKNLDDARTEALGEDWLKCWYEGLPNCLREDVDLYNFGQIVSLYNMIQAWGLLDYAKDRYGKSTLCQCKKNNRSENCFGMYN